MKTRNIISIVSAMVLSVVGVAQAQTYTRQNNANLLNTTNAWGLTTSPSGTDIVKWDSTCGANVGQALGGNVTWGQILITTPGGAITIANTASSTLTLNGVSGTGIDMSAANQNLTINDPVTLGGAQIWSVASGRTLTIPINYIVNNGGFLLTLDGSGSTSWGTINNNTATLTGSGGLTKSGSGNLSLSGLNTGYSGTTTLNGGVTMVTAVGSIGTGNLTLNGGVYEEYWSNTFIRGLGNGVGQVQLIGGTSGFSENGSTGMTIKLGNGTGTVVWGALGEGAATGFFNPSTFVLESAAAQTGSTLDFQNGINLNGATRTIASYKTSNLSSGATISGVISNGGLIKEGAGLLALTGNNTYAGSTTITAGILNVNATTGLGNSSASNTLIFNGGTLRAGGAITSVATRGVTMTATGIIDSNGQAISIAGIISGAGGLTKNGTGTLTLSGSNSNDGTTTLNVGTVSVSTAANLGSAAANLVFNGGTLQITGTGLANFTNLDRTVVFNSGATVGLDIADASNIFTANQTLNQGAGGLTKAGAGTLVINSAHTYTGPTTISAGTLRLDDGGALAGSIINNSVFLVNKTGAVTIGTDFPALIGGTGSIAFGASTTFTATTPTRLQFNALNTTGGGSIILSSVTTPVFGGLSGVTGNLGTIISSGYGSVTDLTLNVPSGNSFTYGGVIADGATGMTLTKTGVGTQILTGNNTYTGMTFLNGGTLQLGVTTTSGKITGTTGLTFNGGTLQFNGPGSNADIDAIPNGAPITVNSSSTFGVTAANAGGILNNETIGAVTLNAGQMNFNWTNGGSSGSLMTLTSLSRSGTASANFNSGFSAASSRWKVTSAGTTTGGQIIGPWYTTGANNLNFASTDYAVYSSDFVAPAAIAGSAETAWTTAANAYTVNAGAVGTGSAGLTATRSITALRSISGANAMTVDNTTDTFSLTSNTFANGDAFVLGGTAPTGLTAGNTYYVVNKVGNTFQVATTPGGVAINFTSNGTSVTATGAITLSTGNNLETYGLLNGVATTTYVVANGTGALTTPSGGGNLYVNAGAGAITMNAPINNNGGNVTLVKNGSGTLTLSSTTSTYSGGTILNAGTLSIDDVRSIGGINNTGGSTAPITVNGSSTISMPSNNLIANFGTGAITIANGATLTVSSSSRGDLRFGGTVAGSGGVTATSGSFWAKYTFTSTANTFTGAITDSRSGNDGAGNNSMFSFNSIADGAGYGNIILNGANDNGITYGSGAVASLDLNNRQLILANNNTVFFNNASSQAVNINTDIGFSGTGARQIRFGLSGLSSHTPGSGLNTINGKLTDNVGGAFSPTFNGGTWVLSGANTYSGATTLSAGSLLIEAASVGSVGSITSSALGTGGLTLTTGTLSSDGTTARTILNPITFGGNVTLGDVSRNGVLTFSANASLGATRTVTINSPVELSGIISGATFGITKAGIGTLALSGANTYTGATTISGGGGVILDYTTQDNSKLSDSTALTLGGGTLTLKGDSGSHVEIVSATSLNVGGTFLTREGANTAKLRMNVITRAAGGTISFADATIADTDTSNINGILGGWATLGNDWAVSVASGAANTDITALSSYTGTLPSTLSAVTTANYTLTGPQTQTAAVSANTVKITGAGIGDTLALGANALTITSASATSLGGILYVGGGDGNYNITSTAGNGLDASAANELVITTVTGTLNVSAKINGSGSTRSLVKTGAGTLVVSSANNYTGVTYVNQGILRIANATATGTTAGGIQVQNGAAVEFANGITIGAEAITAVGTGVANGGALNNYSGTNTYTGAITLGTGGARINSASGRLTLGGTIATSLGNDLYFGGAGDVTVTNVISGVGRVIKNGTGTLTLTANNTYSGATLINEGTMTGVVGGSCSNSAVTVASEGTLAVSVIDNTKQWTCASLALTTDSQLKFIYAVTPGVAPLNIKGDLTFSGTPKIVIAPRLDPGTYPLLTVGGTAPTSQTLPTLSGVTGKLTWIDKTLWLTVIPNGTLIQIF